MKQYKKFFTGPRKLLLALSVLLCVWFGTAYGASAAGGDYTENEISMDVVCGYDGHVKGGRYLPVHSDQWAGDRQRRTDSDQNSGIE